MPFDPDAYLAGKKTGFDPDAYLGGQRQVPQDDGTRSAWEQFLRSTGLALRAPLEGLGDAADFVASPIRSAINIPAEAMGFESPIQGRTGAGIADAIGLPKPETPEEQFANKTASAGYEALLPMGIAAKAAKGMSGAARQVFELLAKNPGTQALLNSLSGAASETTRQAGGDELTQMGAGIAAPVAASLIASPVTAGMRTLKNIVTAPTNAGAKQAAGRIATDVAKGRAQGVIDQIRLGAPPETAAQAAVPAGSAEFAGLERTVRSRMPSEFGPAGTIARGAEAWQQGERNALNAAEDVVRTQLLSQADTAGLSVAPLSMEVARLRAMPGFKDETSRKILSWLDREIVARGDVGTADIAGVDLNDLRRDLGNKIRQKMADPKKPWDKAKATKLLREFQKGIDFEMETAVGNDRWTQELMGPSAQRRGELAAIADRVGVAEQMGAAGAEEARRISRLDEAPVTLPNLLSRPMMAANAVLRFLQGKGGEKTSRTLAEMMLPQNKMGLAKLMEEELARRGARTTLGELLLRSGAAGAMESARVNNE